MGIRGRVVRSYTSRVVAPGGKTPSNECGLRSSTAAEAATVPLSVSSTQGDVTAAGAGRKRTNVRT